MQQTRQLKDSPFTDSIDDIIGLLQGQSLPFKNVQNQQPIPQIKELTSHEEAQDSLTEFKQNSNLEFKQNLNLTSKVVATVQNKSIPVLNNTIRVRYQQNQPKPTGPQGLPRRQAGFTAPKTLPSKTNTTLLFEQMTPSSIRYLAFKPYSGLSIDSKKNENNGYYYRFGKMSCAKLIKGTLEENGFFENQDKNWTLYWCSGTIKNDVYLGLFAYQKVCHFPKTYEMTRKDLMHRNISKMQIEHGLANFNFIPKTYILPAEMSYFIEEYDKHKSQNILYICKPHSSSQGKGIFITDKIQEILNRQTAQNSYVISHYIPNPMLVKGLKFDLRIYVAITCVNPLRVYVYEDGLGRFATTEYNLNGNNGNRYVHLTNYAVQKESPNFIPNSDPTDDHIGSKWSLISLFEFLKLNGVNTVQLWERIDDIIIKTILSVESHIFCATELNVPFRTNCFSLFGFDILLDQNCKPWLLEANLSPSLNIDAPVDLKIKGEMIADLFTMIGIVPLDQRFSDDNSCIKNSNAFANERKTIMSVNQQNAIQLSSFERYIIKESDEENKRSRRWRRIYPTENSVKYKNYFEVDRPLNIVLRNYENERSRILAQSNALNNTNLNSSFSKQKQGHSALAQAGRQKLVI